MKPTRMFAPLLFVTIMFFSFPHEAVGDDAPSGGATLADVHKTLLQAAGYQSTTPPTIAEQSALLHKAIQMLHEIPHVYHGQLKHASQDINAALTELEGGDAAHKAKQLIYSADDEIKSVM